MRLVELRSDSFKRLKAVCIRPSGALTPIVGKNGAGKSSVLDAIESTLRGLSSSPEMPIRRGAKQAENFLDLGDIQVRRKFTASGSTLEVLSPDGAKFKSPQAVLDKLVGTISIDPLAFLRMKPDEQVATLGKIAGIDFDEFARDRQRLFDERTMINRQHKAAKAQLDGLAVVEAPDVEVSITDALAKLKEAQEANGAYETSLRNIQALDNGQKQNLERVADLERQLAKAREIVAVNANKMAASQEAHAKLAYIETDVLEASVADAESINAKVRSMKARQTKAAEVEELSNKSDSLTGKLDTVDIDRNEAVAGAKLPVEGLALGESGILLNGIPLVQCSGAERLRVSVALGLAANPQLKLMLIRDGSLLDTDGMKLLAEMAEAADAQVWIERVQVGDEMGVIIEDGEVVGSTAPAPALVEAV